MSRTMHRLARSTRPVLRKSLIRAVLRVPMIDCGKRPSRSVRLSLVQRVLTRALRAAQGRSPAVNGNLVSPSMAP